MVDEGGCLQAAWVPYWRVSVCPGSMGSLLESISLSLVALCCNDKDHAQKELGEEGVYLA